ncbi:glycoside hydrolase family 16 protein [Laccaria amethystina LaAM-08-1]|uniref:Glycoside hydrolase family 16 protein n=1 Tax=Laccaria amethystina LaAM-08-1 TaxID=1095629 RepID=A0A0C9Y6M3_9AGAR|nr:glycoside hydrolase family 16 protein [Laccaria amethystina LaAM-08-1]
MNRPYAQNNNSTSATSLLSINSAEKGSVTSRSSSFAEKFSLSPSPRSWGTPLALDNPEPDDYLHNPDPRRDRKNDKGGHIFTARGMANLGCLFVLAAGCLMLFAGFPILSHFLTKKPSTQGGFNLGGTNATGQVPNFTGNYGLVDKDTPQDAYTKPSYMKGEQDYVLVFSDEFNVDGRSFYPGDDPFWEAVDLHYWGTNDLEWYDPAGATTKGGALRLTLEKALPQNNHNLSYRSGMIQSWNKFCFTGGILEASVTLPGSTQVSGLWPAIWAMGNLGRAGFGGSLDGMWPYSYDSCDVGTLPNQTYPGTQTPLAAVQNGDPSNGGVLSFLPGQRLSACTCPGESHPGPMRANGSYVGRAAPEIDVFEATIDGAVGKVSLSSQWAPYNANYNWLNTTDNIIIYDPTTTVLNSYKGGVYQQTTSGLSVANQDCYELEKGCFSVFGFQYKPGFDNAYITWINGDNPAWTVMAAGMGPDPQTEISARPVPMEPMYIIANLGFSLNFGQIDFDNLVLPTVMSIDYIRVYQPKNAINIGCDPAAFPTAQYIETYSNVYSNPNITTWKDANQPWPKNRLQTGNC